MPYATKITGSDNTVYDIKDVEARRNRVFRGTCDTAAGTATKVVTVDSDFTLAVGREIAVKFASANTAANPKLNVNSTGAISIYYQDDTIRNNVNVLSQNDYYTFFVYDGSNWVWAGQNEKGAAVYDVELTGTVSSNTWSLTSSSSAKNIMDAIKAGKIINCTFDIPSLLPYSTGDAELVEHKLIETTAHTYTEYSATEYFIPNVSVWDVVVNITQDGENPVLVIRCINGSSAGTSDYFSSAYAYDANDTAIGRYSPGYNVPTNAWTYTDDGNDAVITLDISKFTSATPYRIQVISRKGDERNFHITSKQASVPAIEKYSILFRFKIDYTNATGDNLSSEGSFNHYAHLVEEVTGGTSGGTTVYYFKETFAHDTVFVDMTLTEDQSNTNQLIISNSSHTPTEVANLLDNDIPVVIRGAISNDTDYILYPRIHRTGNNSPYIYFSTTFPLDYWGVVIQGNLSNDTWSGHQGQTFYTEPIEYSDYQTNETNISFSEYESYQQVAITGSTHTFIIDMDADNTFVNYLLVNNSGNSTCTITLQAANGMSWQRFIRPTDAIEVEPDEYIELSFISINYGDELVITKSAPLERGSIS